MRHTEKRFAAPQRDASFVAAEGDDKFGLRVEFDP